MSRGVAWPARAWLTIHAAARSSHQQVREVAGSVRARRHLRVVRLFRQRDAESRGALAGWCFRPHEDPEITVGDAARAAARLTGPLSPPSRHWLTTSSSLPDGAWESAVYPRSRPGWVVRARGLGLAGDGLTTGMIRQSSG